MKVSRLSPGDEVIQKDYMYLDMICLHKAPPGYALNFEMTRYKGGLANQENLSMYLDPGQYTDYFKTKTSDNPDGIETKDFLIRRITAARRPAQRSHR